MADPIDEPATDAPELHPFVADLAASGFAIQGGLPVNLRLRAEALVAQGAAEDPGGLLTTNEIAGTAERLEAERAEAEALEREASKAAPSLKWSKEALVTEAERLGLVLESDANKPAILAAIEAALAAGNEG